MSGQLRGQLEIVENLNVSAGQGWIPCKRHALATGEKLIPTWPASRRESKA